MYQKMSKVFVVLVITDINSAVDKHQRGNIFFDEIRFSNENRFNNSFFIQLSMTGDVDILQFMKMCFESEVCCEV